MEGNSLSKNQKNTAFSKVKCPRCGASGFDGNVCKNCGYVIMGVKDRLSIRPETLEIRVADSIETHDKFGK